MTFLEPFFKLIYYEKKHPMVKVLEVLHIILQICLAKESFVFNIF